MHACVRAWAIYLEDDEDVDAGQDDAGDGHLRLHVDKERLVRHGQRHHLVVEQEGLEGDDDGVAAGNAGSGDGKQQRSTPIVRTLLTDVHMANKKESGFLPGVILWILWL